MRAVPTVPARLVASVVRTRSVVLPQQGYPVPVARPVLRVWAVRLVLPASVAPARAQVASSVREAASGPQATAAALTVRAGLEEPTAPVNTAVAGE